MPPEDAGESKELVLRGEFVLGESAQGDQSQQDSSD